MRKYRGVNATEVALRQGDNVRLFWSHGQWFPTLEGRDSLGVPHKQTEQRDLSLVLQDARVADTLSTVSNGCARCLSWSLLSATAG